MLNDTIINAAQQLIRRSYPLVDGLQDPLLAQTSFECTSSEGVQIHHTGKYHWITSSSTSGTVNVYDSMFSDLTQSTEKQLVECYRTLLNPAGELCVHMSPVQKQSGSVDCGLFAIAVAFELASGNSNLSAVYFDQAKMRQHLLTCFENGEITPFPRTRKATMNNKENPEIYIETFCVCRLPESYGDMIQCDLCDQWYHIECFKLTSIPDEWMCHSCAPPAKAYKLN